MEGKREGGGPDHPKGRASSLKIGDGTEQTRTVRLRWCSKLYELTTGSGQIYPLSRDEFALDCNDYYYDNSRG
ncbi:hypothetical protein TNCV_989561 [Trichonephila clavipes]|nr:hypothetical protein TNCV_989561 [Trichonephila clavipes]